MTFFLAVVVVIHFYIFYTVGREFRNVPVNWLISGKLLGYFVLERKMKLMMVLQGYVTTCKNAARE